MTDTVPHDILGIYVPSAAEPLDFGGSVFEISDEEGEADLGTRGFTEEETLRLTHALGSDDLQQAAPNTPRLDACEKLAVEAALKESMEGTGGLIAFLESTEALDTATSHELGDEGLGDDALPEQGSDDSALEPAEGLAVPEGFEGLGDDDDDDDALPKQGSDDSALEPAEGLAVPAANHDLKNGSSEPNVVESKGSTEPDMVDPGSDLDVADFKAAT